MERAIILRSLKAASLKFAALAAGLAYAAQAIAVDLTAVSFGGANKGAQIRTFYKPCQKATGNRIVAGECNGEMVKVKATVDTNSVSWGPVEVESPELSCGYDEGLFEEFDPAQFGKAEDSVPGVIRPCDVGFLAWFMMLAYNADKLKSMPTSWMDFWDIKRFPGKRGLRKGTKYTLEFAPMADNVVPKSVYDVLAAREGQDRTFEEFDKTKSSIQWWEVGAQPPQYPTFGDVMMSSAYNGRTVAVQKEGNLKVVWNGGIYGFDAWAILKGAKKQEGTLEFIALSM